MYKKYDLKELLQTVQDMIKNNGSGRKVGIIGLIDEIGFDKRDIEDLNEYCQLRIYDSKKFNEDFIPKDSLEKRQFKIYLQKKIEKLSDILERQSGKDLRINNSGGRERKQLPQSAKSENIILSRSDEEFKIALKKIIGRSDIPMSMLVHLLGSEGTKINGYLTGEYKNPSKEFIEVIADFFGIDPRYFLEYRECLENEYKKEKPFKQSDEEFRISFKEIIGSSGESIKGLLGKMHLSSRMYYEYISGRKPEIKFIKRVSDFFNIDPCYFKEYRENKTAVEEETHKEDRPVMLLNYRITKKIRDIFDLPEQSEEDFKVSFKRLIGASGIPMGKLYKAVRLSPITYRKYMSGGKIPPIKKIVEISKFFDIDPHYFREYRENEMLDKKLAAAIELKHKRDIGIAEWLEKNKDFRLNEGNTIAQ